MAEAIIENKPEGFLHRLLKKIGEERRRSGKGIVDAGNINIDIKFFFKKSCGCIADEHLEYE